MVKVKKQKKSKVGSIILIIVILSITVGIPVGFVEYQSNKTGKSWQEIISKFAGGEQQSNDNSGFAEGEKIDFLTPIKVGKESKGNPLISHVQNVDLDNDGLLDIIVCDILSNEITFIRQAPLGEFNETTLADNIIAPSHIQAFDFDMDGDLDLLVSVLGMLFPNNDKIGSVVILENDGQTNFTKHVVVDKIARASDVRGGDLDGDGDNDLAVIQFGYDDGETRWIENLGNWKFESHIIQTLSGGINIEITDIDNDNDNDLITIVSQEWEEIYLFVNDGKGNFSSNLLYGASNDDFGSSGISLTDLDQDNDIDILYTNGDAFDYIPPRPRPWHGVNWLENKGDLEFKFHRITNFGGAYNARPYDVDSDGDLDIFVVSGFNLWDKPESQSFIWLENDGAMKFTRRNITNNPTHLLPLELGDFNNDGKMDMVTGGMHAYPPFDRVARIVLWMNNWK